MSIIRRSSPFSFSSPLSWQGPGCPRSCIRHSSPTRNGMRPARASSGSAGHLQIFRADQDSPASHWVDGALFIPPTTCKLQSSKHFTDRTGETTMTRSNPATAGAHKRQVTSIVWSTLDRQTYSTNLVCTNVVLLSHQTTNFSNFFCPPSAAALTHRISRICKEKRSLYEVRACIASLPSFQLPSSAATPLHRFFRFAPFFSSFSPLPARSVSVFFLPHAAHPGLFPGASSCRRQ